MGRSPERFPTINKQAARQLRSLFSLYLDQVQREREAAQSESEVSQLQGQIDAYQTAQVVMDHLEKRETETVLNRMKNEIKS
jgi:hypothetical protein